MTIKKFLILIIIFFNSFIPVFWENSDTGSLSNSWKTLEEIKQEEKQETKIIEKTIKNQIEKENSKKVEDNIVKKAFKTRTNQILNLNKKSKLEEEKDKNKKIIDTIKIEKKLNLELLEKINNKIINLKKELEEKNKILEKDKKILEELSNNDKAKNKNILDLEKEKTDLKKEKFRLLSKLAFKKEELKNQIQNAKRLENQIQNLKLLEEKYNFEHDKLLEKEKLLKQKNFNTLKEKLKILYIFLAIILFLYWLRFLVLNHTNFKKKHTKIVTLWELALGILIVIFWIWYFFYLFPNLYILIIFLSGYLLLVNAHLIASFMGSLIVVNKYSVWDIVKTWNYLWKIEKIWTIYTIISEIDEKWFLHKNYKYIPNVIIVKEWLEKVKDYTIKQRTFTIRLALNKQNTIFKIIEHIKANILQKYINFRPTHLDPKNNDIFEIKYEQEKVNEVKITFFWFSSEEISRKIKSRIIGYIEKETTKIEKNDEEDVKKEEEKIEEKKDNDFKFIWV